MKFSKKLSGKKDKPALPNNKPWMFITPTNKVPEDLKEIQRLDKVLLRYPTTRYINNITLESDSYSYTEALNDLRVIIDKIDTKGQEWDLYSQFVRDTYSFKSTKCYLAITQEFKEDIAVVSNVLYAIIEDNLRKSGKRVRKDPIMFVCQWLSKHLHRMINNKHIGLKYHRSNGLYVEAARVSREDNDDKRVPTAKTLVKCIDVLVEEGYGINFKGFKNTLFDKTMLSLFLPNTKLLDILKTDTIIDDEVEKKLVSLVDVRDVDKNSILKEFYKQEWIVDIENSKRVLEKHNKLLSETKITVDEIPVPDIQMMRIHNDSDIFRGGRLFDDGTWTTMRKEKRKRVKLGDSTTVTIDLSHLHPSLLYAKEGIHLEDFDPYGGLDVFVDKNLKEKFKDYYNIDNYDPLRNAAKLGLLILVNADDESLAVRALERRMARDFAKGGTVYEDEMQFVGMPRKCAEDIIAGVKEHNKDISHYFCTGIAKDLMRVDSDIILETLDVLVDEGICSLPLHDSITVAEEHSGRAEEVLRQAYIKILGSDMNYKVKFE